MSLTNKKVQAKLTKGMLDLIILQLLQDRPMHGYEIITTIRKAYGIYFGPSTIYPLLGTIEKSKLITSEWNMTAERPRRVYTLTIEGKRTLEYGAGTLRAICKNMTTGENENLGLQHQVQIIQRQPSTSLIR